MHETIFFPDFLKICVPTLPNFFRPVSRNCLALEVILLRKRQRASCVTLIVLLWLSMFSVSYSITCTFYACLFFHLCLSTLFVCSTGSPVENQMDLELDFKVFFFADSCC